MKKTTLSHRILAMVLILIMTFQMLPLNAFATFGDLQAWDPGVDLSTLKQEDAINWPIKIYDYLSDGMLFEWMDTNTNTSSSSSTLPFDNDDASSKVSQYGGGYKPPVTTLGIDFTYDASDAYSSTTYSPQYGYSSQSWGKSYTLTKKTAVDYSSPQYLKITDGTDGAGRNLMITRFASNQSTAAKIRYMTLIYRSKGLSDDTVQLRFTNETSSFTGVKNGTVTIKESTNWTYQIIDLYSLIGSKTDIQYIWFTCYNTKDTSKLTSAYSGMDSGDYLDLAYIGYFNTTTEANNYASEALKFIAEPGEYLGGTPTFTYTHSYVTPAKRSDYLNNIFSLNYCWKNKDTTPKMFDSASNSANVRYGMDFTTHSMENGWKTNAYTSDTFWTWSNGTILTLKNTINNVTRQESVTMSKINVEQKTQTNGAQYVTLTTNGPSKILLSKFREDHQTVVDGYVPLTADVEYMVLVYRANGWTSSDKYGLWAQGYLDSTSSSDRKTIGLWKHAGLTKLADWTLADNVNQLSFPADTGWQYTLIPVSQTIGEKDSEMSNIDRIANLGLYLPTLTNGKSLDIAYVGYFKNNPDASDGAQFDIAHAFGANAVNYMNAAAKVTQDKNESKSYANNRKWYGGGNKSFGMLYSSGGGQYLPSGNSGGESTNGTVYEYGYEFDTWMIGYRTNAQSGDSFNAARYNLVWNSSTGKYDKVKYTAAYTPSGTSTGHANSTFQPNATGTTNNIYFIAATEEDTTWGSNDGNSDNGKDFNTTNVKFDGYQLLETITSGVMTAGLLEGSLQTVVVNGMQYRVPVYRQETVEYIAYNLLYGLRVPMKDATGNYNTRYIKGTASTKFGGVDLNGDGKIGMINYDGDSRNGNETNEASVDLATALRHELGMTPRLGNSVNTTVDASGNVTAAHSDYEGKMGNYQETLAKSRMLFGEFKDCRNAIDTAMDAAYYLLNNIFISNSYNQQQDDYDYLTLSSATVNALGHSGYAYVFDAGFTTGKTGTNGATFTDDGTNKSAIVYSPYSAANGTGTISMEGVTGKTRFDYGTSGTSWTTRFPFLPVTDAAGDFAGQTQSYYFLDDAQRVYTEGSNSYKNRNFNYVIASNGEFVYREADDLFFEFEGDDDVYLFINGELVLDIGGAHSITSVYIDVNDYVNAAAEALKTLEQYGYHKDMSIDQFDKWISASEIQYLNSELEPTGQTVANPFTAEQIATFKRQHRLNLSDGQVCQFDFYYMERHGWGANMRIVTNMHITDPNLSVEKTAYQFGEQIEYGGVIDPTTSVEYNFKLTNTGNTKLYNITWKDDVLGITMDPTNGLVVNDKMNGVYVMNASGGYLQAKDLYVVVTGTDNNGNYGEFVVTFDEVDGDGGQGSLKRFLKKLESDDGTESGFDDAEVTNAGSGLWVGASVQFKGMYYMLTPAQTEARMVDNTVYLTATTRSETDDVGCRTLRSDASHRLYTNGFPIHYQWAGHNIFMNMEHLLEQAKIEAQKAGSQLSLYQQFFKSVTLGNLYTQPCDQFGRVGGDYSSFLTAYTDSSGHTGYLINYKNPGIYTFYLLMYMKTGKDAQGNNKTFASSGVNASSIGEGCYAILRSQVFVADVEDSVYVLDYGLSTESLDTNGSLFQNDYLFGAYGTIRTKLMGITGEAPSFIDPAKVADATKTGITFNASGNRIYTANGFFNANLAIPEGGKEIAYDSLTGEYTLTGVGTMKISANLPTDGKWDMPYLYYWYDDGTSGPSWPGTPMKKLGAGNFEIDIPADVTNVIISNGSAALKTNNLKVTPGMDSTISVEVHNGNNVIANITTIMEEVTIHVKAPADWQQVYLNHWNENGEIQVFPGDLMTEKDADGYWTFKVKGDVTHVVVSDGSNNLTYDLQIYAGKETWIDVSNTVLSSRELEDGTIRSFFDAKVKYTLSDGYKVHASVPSGWKDTVYLYYWHEGMVDDEMTWPGKPMTKDDLWYTYDGLVPADVTQIIINDGTDGYNHQTVNITVTPGLETWVMVQNEVATEGENTGKYLANVAYGSETSTTGLTFTPQKFLDQENNMWMAITVHSTNGTPTKLGSYIDIHNEVQMYKKITVIPATVVYYEDTFGAVEYNDALEGSFTHHGSGSGQLSQSIDQKQPYGQDSAYQDAENELYSGHSMTEVEITTEDVVATFEFKGTGFEIIGRTNAFNAASFMARVYKKSDYSADAYEKYMEAAQNYMTQSTVLVNVENAYSAAVAAYNKAVQKRDAAAAAPDDETAQTAYANALSSLNGKLKAYQEALQAHTAKDGDYDIGGDVANSVQVVAPENLVNMTYPELPVSPFVTVNMVYTQFDHGNNGGAESINQVPVVRVNDLELGEYVVEIAGLPLFIFDEKNNYEVIGTQPTSLYLDGYRIFKPIGDTHSAYIPEENGAQVDEIRDLIAQGIVGVGMLDNSGLNVSTGTTTWTESLGDNDFDASNKETYHSIKVGSSADYLIQGPNNEVYMEGNATNSALIFYVKEDASSTHELQIAVRALDYGKYYGAGSTALNAQLQYGILTETGYVWKNLVRVVSGTEQYYSIPYTECPVDTQGRYQIVIRAINPQTNANTMVSYSSIKTNGLTIEQVEGVGEGTVIHYQNGILVKPEYELVFINPSFQDQYTMPFDGNQLTFTMDDEWVYVYVRSTLTGETYNFYAYEDPGQVGKAVMYRFDDVYAGGNKWSFNVQGYVGAEVTFTIKQTSLHRLELSQCVHTYGEGVITREPTCKVEGARTYTCTKCGNLKNDPLPIVPSAHEYAGGVCIHCHKNETRYYLVGYINGKNHGCEGDYANMGDYLFVDGKLTVRFNKDSYVYVKKDGNTAWYMTSSYVTDSTAILGNTNMAGYTEKMYVPCGMELVFTLIDNKDGTLTLHYEEPCAHDWGTGVVTLDPTCTTDGVRTYTCSKCFVSKSEQIPATGHIYNNSVCACGDIQMRTVYFKNTGNWANVYIWAWDANGNYTGGVWPGAQMELVEGETDIYSYVLPGYVPNVIFSNNDGVQTEDLSLVDNGGDMYVYSTGMWVNHTGVVDYYLVGNINGVDYGYGDNANNMGIYKFVDGKLKVSFTRESYVLVKTTGNASWFMTEAYCDTYNATLYNTDTGASEKMFIPGGTEIEFTLTVNDDGTLSLIAHSWGSVVTKNPSCTAAGEKTHICYLCNDTYKEAIPALGHTFVDNVCTVCGEVKTVTVYFKNTAGWENVYIYVFTEGTPSTEFNGAWPGAQMSLVEGETDLYYFEISALAKSVIFNNGSGGAGNQTDNLHAPVDENNKFTYGANVWTTVDEEVELPEVKKLYFVPGEWAVDNAWFAAYFFGNGDAWAKLTDADGDGIYECVLPEGYTNVIFCRMNKDMTDTSWDAKWNQTIDLALPADGRNLFTITNAWGATEGKGDGVWSTFTCSHNYTVQITVFATCETDGEKTFTCTKCGDSYTEVIAAAGHGYTEEITTAAGCETAGEKTFTCTYCGDTYTEEIEAIGHNYVDGICSGCGENENVEPVQVAKVYLKPDSNWASAGAWFAAWFPGAETWVTLTDNFGNGYYQCEIPANSTGVVFVRMNPAATAPSWNDGEKWNQTVDLALEADRMFVIENPWNESVEWKATGSWADYDATVAECNHNYVERVTTPAGCTSTGEKTFTCSACSTSYTEEIAATGHKYANGICTGCGQAEPKEAVILYMKPNSNWRTGNARFAAYFFNDYGNTWRDMTDADGDGIYQCEAPEGYNTVIYCRMNPGATANNWDNKWNQTGNLTVLHNGNNLCTINEDQWDCGTNVTWSTFTATYSLRSTRSMTKAMSSGAVITGDEDVTMNLSSIKDQMSSDVIYGQIEEFVPVENEPVTEEIKINGASLVLSDDINMNYYVTVPTDAENVYMTFEMNGVTTVVTDYTIGENGRYCFTFSGINAQQMGDNISATVYATVGGQVVSASVAKYSVRTYCVNQLNKNADNAKLVSLISDLLVYGEKTQIYQGYKTDALVTEGLTLTPSTYTALDESFDQFAVTGTANASVRYTGVTLVLSNKVVMRLTVKTDDPANFTYRVNVAGKDYDYTATDLVDAGNGKYYLYFDELKATTFDDTVTATILSDGQTVGQTVTYSVNSYIYRNQNTDNVTLGQLLEAIYNYGHSAKEYVG